MIDSKHFFNHFTNEEVVNNISEDSISCIPIGATEQHGQPLPLNKDTILANSFTEKRLSEYHKKNDLLLLPPLEYFLSCVHLWASGSISISIELFVNIFQKLIKRLIVSQPTRDIIINGNGGWPLKVCPPYYGVSKHL